MGHRARSKEHRTGVMQKMIPPLKGARGM